MPQPSKKLQTMSNRYPLPNNNDATIDTPINIEQSPRRKHATHSILGWLLLCTIITSSLNIFTGHHSVRILRDRHWRNYEHNHEAPHVQQREIETTLVDRATDDTVYNGEYIAQLLRGEKQLSNTATQRLKYKPGSIPMSSAESLQYCYIDMNRYEHHFLKRSLTLVSSAKHHKLIYRNVPKSASSSARAAMEDIFGGEDSRHSTSYLKRVVQEESYDLVSFIREPLNRFYSSYDESYFRFGPWFGDGPLVAKRPNVKRGYIENKHKVDQYPYLYDGMETLKDFQQYYCPQELLNNGNVNKCQTADTVDDGELTGRFEQFVRDYNGLNPFDVHLHLQVTFLSDSETGEPLPITQLYNASQAESGWEEIANEKDVEVPEDGMTHGRKSPRRFNVNLVSDATKRKICQILALDYCCLNLELPAACKEGWDNEEDGVYCAMERKDVDDRGSSLKIHPWSDP